MPEPDEEVVVRYGDLVDLEADRNELRAGLEHAREDLRSIQLALGVEGEDNITAHQLVVSHLLPRIRRLVETEGKVLEAGAELSRLVVAGDGPVMDLGNGRSAKLVGRRLPDAIAKDIPGAPLKGGKHGPQRRPGKHR